MIALTFAFPKYSSLFFKNILLLSIHRINVLSKNKYIEKKITKSHVENPGTRKRCITLEARQDQRHDPDIGAARLLINWRIWSKRYTITIR